MEIKHKEDSTGNRYIEVDLVGSELIQNPILNKGNSFSATEREQLKLRGFLLAAIPSLAEEVARSYAVLQQKKDGLEKYIYLRSLQDCNETLFYALVNSHIEEMLPLIYTPVVGQACQQFSSLYQRPRGLFLSYPERDYLDEILANSCCDGVEIIVVTDGERILGLGDLGAGGMGIPIGKLAIYTAGAGIPPYKTLPITLDVGTDNENLLNDPNYLGWRHRRVRGEDYDQFVEKFIQALTKRFPNILLQWEDFARENALKLLQRYQGKICSFNDDIQGTAATVVGGLLAAINASGIPLLQHKIAIMGAGSAGVGISNLIVDAMVEQGLARKNALENIFLIDKEGLLTEKIECYDFQKPFAKSIANLSNWKVANANNISLLEVVTNTKITAMIGVCTVPGVFTHEIIAQLAQNCARPIVFPLSNPTSKAEASPHDVLDWTAGKAIVGTGSPFAPYVTGDKTRRIDQVNNCYVFPGIGLGVRAVAGKRVTNRMFLTAARALAEISPSNLDPNANLFPPFAELRQVSRQIALAIAREIVQEGLTEMKDLDEEKIANLIDDYRWEPDYLPYQASP